MPSCFNVLYIYITAHRVGHMQSNSQAQAFEQKELHTNTHVNIHACLEVRAAPGGRNPEVGPDAETMEECCVPTCSVCFLTYSGLPDWEQHHLQ